MLRRQPSRSLRWRWLSLISGIKIVMNMGANIAVAKLALNERL